MAGSVVVDLFLSVDGWAGSDGLPAYFGYGGPELQEWITAESERHQVTAMGRRTYDALSAIPVEAHGELWERTDKLVFSRTLQDVVWANTRIGRDLVAEVTALRDGGDLPVRTIGSLSLARQLLAAGLVDRLRLMAFPLLAGPAGRESAFDGVASTDLRVADQRLLDGRVLLVEYTPTGGDIPRA